LQKVEKNQETTISQNQALKLNKLGTDAYNEEELEAIDAKKQKANENAKTKRVVNKEKEAKQQEQYIEEPRRSSRSTKGINKNLFFDS
jgi:hypothetical protein